MTAKLLRSQGRLSRPWRNGGGVTHDVSVFPEGAGNADFLWRASIATIAAPGPFSPFAGVDRALLIVHGELAIRIGDGGEQRIGPGSPALLFRGEEAVSAYPVGEPCFALNIMTRRDRVSARLDRWTAIQPTSADALLLFVSRPTMVTVDDDIFDLAADDALLLDRPARPSSIDGPVIAAELFY